jgi:hypothetical protein
MAEEAMSIGQRIEDPIGPMVKALQDDLRRLAKRVS